MAATPAELREQGVGRLFPSGGEHLGEGWRFRGGEVDQVKLFVPLPVDRSLGVAKVEGNGGQAVFRGGVFHQFKVGCPTVRAPQDRLLVRSQIKLPAEAARHPAKEDKSGNPVAFAVVDNNVF